MDPDAMLRALAVPARLSIFRQLLERKHCVRSLSKKLGITESAVSQHMKVLREAGLAEAQPYGRHIHFLPRQEALDYLAAAFGQMRDRAAAQDREDRTCRCEYREERER